MALPAEKWTSAPKAAHTPLSLAAVVLHGGELWSGWVLGFSGSHLVSFLWKCKNLLCCKAASEAELFLLNPACRNCTQQETFNTPAFTLIQGTLPL